MYDVIDDALAGAGRAPRRRPASGRPRSAHDILPLLEQMVDAQWVNAGFLAQFGWHGPYDFARGDVLCKLSRPSRDARRRHATASCARRSSTRSASRARRLQQPLLWPPIYGDAFGNYYDSPRVYFTVTQDPLAAAAAWAERRLRRRLRRRAAHARRRSRTLPLAEQPATLDRAALHWCMGGPFHPGCEMTWPMRQRLDVPRAVAHRRAARDAPEPDYGPVLT